MIQASVSREVTVGGGGSARAIKAGDRENGEHSSGVPLHRNLSKKWRKTLANGQHESFTSIKKAAIFNSYEERFMAAEILLVQNL